MTLNYIWLAFFVIAFIVALFRLIFFGDIEPFNAMTGSTFEMAKTGFELSLGLTGVMTLWLGHEGRREGWFSADSSPTGYATF